MTQADSIPPGDSARYRPSYEIAAERILEYIAREGLEPGTRLPTEKDLAEAVGMTRTVTREAVKILSAVGRLSVQKGRGIFVAGPELPLWSQSFTRFLPANQQQVEELFEFRGHVEAMSTRLAAQRATPPLVKAIRDAAQRTAAAADDHDHDGFIAADIEFHSRIGVASGNTFLSAALEWVQHLQQQVNRIGMAGTVGGPLKVAAGQHAAIAEAIADGDEDQAVDLMSAHIVMTLRQFQQELRARMLSK
ncbi:MAG TPA: FCD domain-containing protein [Actinokineospora sp.]|nr:FCD domain-containing protein [Actinokineospora sp.]